MKKFISKIWLILFIASFLMIPNTAMAKKVDYKQVSYATAMGKMKAHIQTAVEAGAERWGAILVIWTASYGVGDKSETIMIGYPIKLESGEIDYRKPVTLQTRTKVLPAPNTFSAFAGTVQLIGVDKKGVVVATMIDPVLVASTTYNIWGSTSKIFKTLSKKAGYNYKNLDDVALHIKNLLLGLGLDPIVWD